MGSLILVRHGQSEWNKKNLFTGWVDVSLSARGVEEALSAGKATQDIPIHRIYVSELIRAQMTAMLMMSVHKSGKDPVFVEKGGNFPERSKSYGVQIEESCLPVYTAWELNERYYGELQGKNKDEVRAEFGEEQVHIWRRSYDIPPPGGESLQMTAARSIPFFQKVIVPKLDKENILISAHGNSLRSIVMEIEGLTREEVLSLELPTGKPRIYQYNNQIFTQDV
jgi:2,3-bisphosphoglycerate-dependent phosphoglycerate mutase